jgi:hypothetical protein
MVITVGSTTVDVDAIDTIGEDGEDKTFSSLSEEIVRDDLSKMSILVVGLEIDAGFS